MDQRARFDDFDELVETIRDAVQAKIRKGGPMMIAEDSADGHTVKLQPLVKAVVKALDGTVSLEELPTLPDAPVHFMGGGGITTTFGLKKGDEAIGIHLDANFDAWHQQGGVQTPNDARIHNLTDTICIPGVRSDPNKLKGVSPDSTQTRTDDKKSLHDVSHTAVTSIREFAVQQVNGAAIQSELKGARHVIDPKSILTLASKILLNC